MPPFAGRQPKLEALVQLLSWRRTGMPQTWPVSNDPATLEQIQAWLDEVGTTPGIELMGRKDLAAAESPIGAAAGATAKERR